MGTRLGTVRPARRQRRRSSSSGVLVASKCHIVCVFCHPPASFDDLPPGSPPLSQSKECQTSNWKSHKAFCSNQVGVNNSLQHLANATPGTVERETYEVEARLKRWIEVRFWFYRQMCPRPETDWPDSFQSALSRKGRNCCNSRSHHAIDTRKGPDSPPCCHTLAQPRLLGLEYRACYLTLFPPDRTRCHYPRGGTKAGCSSRRKDCGGTNQR